MICRMLASRDASLQLRVELEGSTGKLVLVVVLLVAPPDSLRVKAASGDPGNTEPAPDAGWCKWSDSESLWQLVFNDGDL